MTNTLHAHVSTYSRDCDGGHGHDYVMMFSESELAERENADGINDFSDIHFMQRVMMSVASPYAVEYGMTVKVDSTGIEVNEATDEGFRSAEVRWCREACEETYDHHFDEYAEAMGY